MADEPLLDEIRVRAAARKNGAEGVEPPEPTEIDYLLELLDAERSGRQAPRPSVVRKGEPWPACTVCGGKMKERSGPHGAFLYCTNSTPARIHPTMGIQDEVRLIVDQD